MQRWLRKLHCRGCGTKFHKEDPEKFGFQSVARTKSKQSFRGINQRMVAGIYDKLTPEQQQALNFYPPGLQMTSESSAQILEKAKEQRKLEKFASYCRPCIDSKEGRTLCLEPAAEYSVPKGHHQIVQTIDAFDFPASVGPITPNTDYVITRADLVLNHKNQLSRLKDYASSVLGPLGVAPSRVHVVSVAKKFGLKELAQRLTRRAYFQGKTGTGKTELVHALAGLSEKTWSTPFKTRAATLVSEQLVDTPSWPEAEKGNGIYGVLKPGLVRSVITAKPLLKKDGRYNVEPTVAKPGHFVSIGGLVAIEVPQGVGNAVHVWAVFGGCGPNVTRAVSTLDKVVELNGSTHPAHEGWSMTDSNQQMIPRLEAEGREISLAIRGLGSVFIKSFGKYEGGKYKIWSLPGVEVVERPDILPVLLHRKSKFRKETGPESPIVTDVPLPGAT